MIFQHLKLELGLLLSSCLVAHGIDSWASAVSVNIHVAMDSQVVGWDIQKSGHLTQVGMQNLAVMIFASFSPSFLFLSKSQATTHSTSLNHDMFPHSLSHVPFLLSYLSSSFGHFG